MIQESAGYERNWQLEPILEYCFHEITGISPEPTAPDHVSSTWDIIARFFFDICPVTQNIASKTTIF
jgi:hypothetical protein